MQKHPRSCLRRLPGPNLQHMRPGFPSPPPTHTHSETPSLPFPSLPAQPSAEGVVFPQAITEVTKFVFAQSTKCLHAGPNFVLLFFQSLRQEKGAKRGGEQPRQLLPFRSGLRKSCRSALSQGRSVMKAQRASTAFIHTHICTEYVASNGCPW